MFISNPTKPKKQTCREVKSSFPKLYMVLKGLVAYPSMRVRMVQILGYNPPDVERNERYRTTFLQIGLCSKTQKLQDIESGILHEQNHTFSPYFLSFDAQAINGILFKNSKYHKVSLLMCLYCLK